MIWNSWEFNSLQQIPLILVSSKVAPSVLSRFRTKRDNARRCTAFCAVCNRLQSSATIAVVVAKWSSFEFDKPLHFVSVLIGDN